jgi:hypothetical protein
MRNVRGSSLVGLLAALVVIGLMITVFYMYKPFGQTPVHVKGSTKQTQVGQVMDKGQEPVCIHNLQQIRLGMDALKVDGSLPADLPSLKAALKYPDQMWVCPVDGQPYVYNPQTGEVHCPHLGHEKF